MVQGNYTKQTEIEFFWPLTEQMKLDLDYGPTHLFYRAQGIAGVHSMPIRGSIHEFTTVSTMTPSTIQFHATNESAGYWKVGEGLQMHNKKKPNWLHQQMTKIFFGWKWKDNG
jgi:hypothetical protein